MTIQLPARIGACACLGIALAMGLLALRAEPQPTSPPLSRPIDLPTDPLEATLRRCQLAGQAAGSDLGCLSAWAENRRRFLGAASSEPAADHPDGKSRVPAGLPAAHTNKEP